MNKHTPGPWRLSKEGEDMKDMLMVVSTDSPWGTWVCTLPDNDEVSRPNANLIAASPELLEALERCYLDAITFLNEGDFKRKVEWDAGYIVDALKKARGES